MAQTLTKEAARANGDKRLLQVVGIVRIGIIGVDKDRQTVHLILLDEHIVAEQRIKNRIERQNEGHQAHEQGQGRQHPFAACAAHTNDDGARNQHNQARAQVAHGNDGQKRNGQHAAELDVVANGIDATVILRAKRSNKEDGDELGKLNRLERQTDPIMPTYKFIDLFAGLGGFHLALEQLGCKCVFASELQQDLRTLYESNFGMKCAGDINLINIEKDIPSHDILCGGFPCQPFSQAGKQQGFQDEKERGNLFNKIMEVLEFHKPEFVFLENVPNLKSHDKGNTYRVIHEKLSMLYEVKEDIISPHYFGIPQHRTRMYIVGRLKSRGGLQTFAFPKHEERPDCDISQILIPEDTDYMSLRPVTRKHMAAWQKFLDLLSQNKSTLPTFPIWAMEFGATYDYEGVAPYFQKRQQLSGKKGKFGEDIVGNSKDDFLQLLPIYSQGKPKTGRQFPDWKKQFIRQNRQFYQDNKSWIDAWIDEIKQEGFENSHQKFEWNCGYEEHPTIYNKIIQFRPSGMRVKLPTYSPALVLTTTQIPIIPWLITPNGEKGRYMTRKEGAKLQCMEELAEYPDTIASAFKAFGNAVNVEVVKRIAINLLFDGNETNK